MGSFEYYMCQYGISYSTNSYVLELVIMESVILSWALETLLSLNLQVHERKNYQYILLDIKEWLFCKLAKVKTEITNQNTINNQDNYIPKDVSKTSPCIKKTGKKNILFCLRYSGVIFLLVEGKQTGDAHKTQDELDKSNTFALYARNYYTPYKFPVISQLLENLQRNLWHIYFL